MIHMVDFSVSATYFKAGPTLFEKGGNGWRGGVLWVVGFNEGHGPSLANFIERVFKTRVTNRSLLLIHE